MNSIHGGVIFLVELHWWFRFKKNKDKTKIVPNPLNDTVENQLFRVTGASYFWQFPYLMQILMVRVS